MDKALKQRLVGATVLIALAVIVLPMLLGGRPEGTATETKAIEIPPEPPELSFETRRFPIGDEEDSNARPSSSDIGEDNPALPAPRIPAVTESDEKTEPAADSSGSVVDVTGLGPAPGEESPLPQPDVTADPDVEAPAAEEEPNTTPTSAPEQRPLPVEGGRYIVQVASFGAADNANRLSARLQEAGYSVMTDTVKSDVGTLHRVRVGPFESEARARETVLALSSSIDGVRPRVMDLQPERSAQVTTPEDPLVRWVVQVGSFASSENAENVVASLRLKGMSAYRESVSSGNSEIFRVRVGPFLSREDAIAAEREINESLSVSAVVMSIR